MTGSSSVCSEFTLVGLSLWLQKTEKKRIGEQYTTMVLQMQHCRHEGAYLEVRDPTRRSGGSLKGLCEVCELVDFGRELYYLFRRYC